MSKIKSFFKKSATIVLVSLVLTFINDNIWNYTGKEFWLQYLITFGLVLIATTLMYFGFIHKKK
jgi:hypothetical protein